MGSAQSARGIQLRGSVGRLVRGWRGVSSFPAASLARAFSGVHFLRGGAPRPAPVRLGKARGEGGPRRESRALQRPLARTSPLPGAVDLVLAAPSLPAGRDGAPRSRRGCRAGRTVLSAPQPRRVARAGIGSRKRRQGSAAMSATHRTRLETRTKESNACASQRVVTKPRGAMKVRAGARRPRWDPGPPAGRGAPPARLARSVGEVERERTR